jgi:hypothetical protein
MEDKLLEKSAGRGRFCFWMLAWDAVINQMVVKCLNLLFFLWNLVLCVGYAGLSDLNKLKSIYFDWLVIQKLMSLGNFFSRSPFCNHDNYVCAGCLLTIYVNPTLMDIVHPTPDVRTATYCYTVGFLLLMEMVSDRAPCYPPLSCYNGYKHQEP